MESGKLHPRDAKMILAGTIVRMYHGRKAADAAEQHFKRVFQQNSLPEDMKLG